MHTRLFIPVALSAALLVGCAHTVVIERPISESSTAVAVSSALVTEEQRPSDTSVSSTDSTPGKLRSPAPDRPESVRIDMDFASQAPTGNWGPPYDEACEEASLIIVHHYLQGTPLDAEIMDSEIHRMIALETSMGLPIDIDIHQLADVAGGIYDYSADVIEGDAVTIERIEQEIARGNPVIVPLAGQDIGNPYYSGDGPPYHMLVIVGYDDDSFMTHDVGTKRGENYVYPKNVIMSAIHDWNGSVDTIRSGPKRMLIVTK